MFSGGYLAVDFFFALSGFVLAHAYGTRPLSFARFLRVRAIRLYPLYLVGLVAGVGAAIVVGSQLPQLAAPIALGLLFLPTPPPPSGGALYPLNPPAWSLFFEILANATWFPIRSRIRGGLAIGCLGVSALALVSFNVRDGGITAGGYWESLAGGLVRVTYSFIAGIFTYQVWSVSSFRPRFPGWLVALLLLLLLATPLSHKLSDPIVVILLVPPLVYLGASCGPSSGASAWAQRQLGAASYGIYVLHFPIILVVDQLFIADRFVREIGIEVVDRHPSLLTTPVTILVTVGGALVLDGIYDRPVRRWLVRNTASLSSQEAAT